LNFLDIFQDLALIVFTFEVYSNYKVIGEMMVIDITYGSKFKRKDDGTIWEVRGMGFIGGMSSFVLELDGYSENSLAVITEKNIHNVFEYIGEGGNE
jgi:hypothetical protein